MDVAEFIGVKSFRARGKRVTTYEIEEVKFVEPIIKEEPAVQEESSVPEVTDAQSNSGNDEEDEGETKQMSLEI